MHHLLHTCLFIGIFPDELRKTFDLKFEHFFFV